MYVFLVVLVIIVILLFIPVSLDAAFIHLEKKRKFALFIKTLGGLINFDIIKKTKEPKKKKQLQEKTDIQTEKETKQDKKDKRSKLHLSDYLNILEDLSTQVKKRLVFNKLVIVLDVGMTDAADTALLTGWLMMIISNLHCRMVENYRVYEYHSQVTPHYDQSCLWADLACKVSIRPWDALVIGLVALKAFIRIRRRESRARKRSYSI